MIRVAFDSNVWRPVAEPTRFPKDASFTSFSRIHQAICEGTVAARISEIVFTLEGISRAGRRQFFAKYRPNFGINITPTADGAVHVGISMASDTAAHPGANTFLSSHLTDALRIGFRLIRCPRIVRVPEELVSEFT